MNTGSQGIDTSDMQCFFAPQSIAIVGATAERNRPGGRPLVALRRHGYTGRVFPVNPRYEEIEGWRCYPRLLDLPESPDLVVISVPAAAVLDVLGQCAEMGVRAVIIFTAGFAEIGEEGETLQRRITEVARRYGIRVLGPNCLGLLNLTNAVMASFAYIMEIEPAKPPTLGFVTQSGAFGSMIFSDANAAGVGFSSFVSVGNEADAEFADFVGYLLDDPHTQVIGGYLEGAKDGRKLRRVAEEALRREKPILVMKVGRTRAGARAAASHTGSLAGDDEVYEALFRQTGIVRIETLGELTAFAILHRSGRTFSGKRVAILSGSGGQGVLLADKCESLGLEVPEITGATRARLQAALPAFGSARNPVDLTAQAGRDPSMPAKCLRALIEDDGIDVVLMQAFFQHARGTKHAQEFIDLYRSTSKPIVVIASSRPDREFEQSLQQIRDAGVPLVPDGQQAAQAIAHLVGYHAKVRRSRARDATPRLASALPRGDVAQTLRRTPRLSEFEAKRVLESYGIPVTRERLVTSGDAATRAAAELGFPVALKVQSSQILHKTDADALRLGLGSEDEVRHAFAEVLANAQQHAPQAEVDGVLVQEMVTDGVEVILGATRDPVHGHVIMFGLGGIFVEVLRDVAFRIAPLTRLDAEEMVGEIRGSRILEGMRGRPPVDRQALIEVILRVSALLEDHAETIEELDINPLVVLPKGVKAVDALITCRSD